MERHNPYKNKSIFYLLHNTDKNDFHTQNQKFLFHMPEESNLILSAELIKLQERVHELQRRVTNELSDITEILKELEYYLPLGNNNKKLNQIIFSSKIFLPIIESITYAKPRFIPKILAFIEKMLRGNKHISKYLGGKPEFIKKILNFMKKESLFEISVKISEEVFMDCNKLIPIGQFYKEIESVYLQNENSHLNTMCRVLAIMIFDHKKIEFKQIFKYRENMKIRPEPKVTTENQSVCYHLPKFLHNLVIVLKNKFNQTMTAANSLPIFYNLLNNNNPTRPESGVSNVSSLNNSLNLNLNNLNDIFNMNMFENENEDISSEEEEIMSQTTNSVNNIGNSSNVDNNNHNNNLHSNNSNTDNNININNQINLNLIINNSSNNSNISSTLFTFPIQNAEEESISMFNQIRKEEMMGIIHCNIFSNFTPDWSIMKNRNGSRDNIFNNYMKVSRIYKKIKHKGKIKENNKNYINVLKYSTCQIEMLFVISTLVGCKRKCEIQDKLSDYDIIDILNNYLEYMEWGNTFNESNRPYFDVSGVNLSDDAAYHGRGCNCDSDTAIKIQYLRFIYTYCCRDKNNVHNKLNLLSVQDLQKFFSPQYFTLFYFYFMKNFGKYKFDSSIKFNKMFHKFYQLLPENFHEFFFKNQNFPKNQKIENNTLQDIILNLTSYESINKFILYVNNHYDKIGLLNKLIVKYVQECYYSSSKFWLASCIEVMLRGNNTFFQSYICSTGLMGILLYDIIYSKSDQTQILQLSFDILGELIKFNKASFLLLNNYFVDNNEFGSFTQKVLDSKSLIDSNVFMRSVIISMNYFDEEDAKLNLDGDKYFSMNCKFCLFVNNNILHVFNSLIKVVKPNDINQTNISCINTALLILILQFNKQKLAEFLNNVRKTFEDSNESLTNFKHLIIIWKDFYNYRPKDSSSLQHSTMIGFNTWQRVTSVLINEDETEPSSLFYKY